MVCVFSSRVCVAPQVQVKLEDTHTTTSYIVQYYLEFECTKCAFVCVPLNTDRNRLKREKNVQRIHWYVFTDFSVCDRQEWVLMLMFALHQYAAEIQTKAKRKPRAVYSRFTLTQVSLSFSFHHIDDLPTRCVFRHSLNSTVKRRFVFTLVGAWARYPAK